MENFRELEIEKFAAKPCSIFHKDWTLIAAGTPKKFNAMTASWGEIGTLWFRPTAFVFIRPSRFTKEFVDAGTHFSLSFLPAKFKKEMAYLGKVSGRDEDKISKSGLTPIFDAASGTPFFAESSTVIHCKKLYAQEMKGENLLGNDAAEIIEKCYPLRDFHTFYVGEIEKILAKN